MSDGLDNLFSMGTRWCTCIVAFASLISLADFQTSDSQNLSQIRSSVSHIQNSTEDIATYWYSFNEDSVYNGIVDYDGVFYHPVMSMDVTLLDRLELLQTLILAPLTNISRHVRSIDDTFTQYASDESNRFNQMQASIGNVTNKLDFWGQAIVDAINSNIGVGVVNTNLPFILSEIFSSSLRSDVTELFNRLYGYYPAGTHVDDLVYLYYWFGGNGIFSQDNLSQLVFLDELNRLYSSYNGNYDAYTALSELSNYIDNDFLYPIAEARYYEYGTRPLTDSFFAYTNDFANLATNILDFFTRATNEYPIATTIESDGDGGFKFSQAFGDVVGGLAQSFTGNVETNVTSIETNSISQVEDASYQASLEQFQTNNLESTSYLQSLTDAVDNINSAAQSFIPTIGHSDSYEMDFGEFEVFDAKTSIKFTFNRPGKLYWDMQSFLFATLKVLGVLSAVYVMYSHIAGETPL